MQAPRRGCGSRRGISAKPLARGHEQGKNNYNRTPSNTTIQHGEAPGPEASAQAHGSVNLSIVMLLLKAGCPSNSDSAVPPLKVGRLECCKEGSQVHNRGL